MARDQRKRGSLETNIPAMNCGYIIRKFAHQTFCTAHNIAAGGQCCVKVHKQSTVVNVMPNDKKMNNTYNEVLTTQSKTCTVHIDKSTRYNEKYTAYITVGTQYIC